MMTIVNTLPEFYWVTNMLETMISAETWLMITSATTYTEYHRAFLKAVMETGGDPSAVPFQAHDFSMRGMSSCVSAAMSGFAVLAAGGQGTDCLPAIDLAEDYYGANSDEELVGMSVNATEHSVMCSNSKDSEIETFRNLMTNVYPEGILSVVSDTWDFWKVVTEYLPALKEEILLRRGKLVIRPDSGDPVDIICGYKIYTGKLGEDWDVAYFDGDGYYARRDLEIEANSFPESYCKRNEDVKPVQVWEVKGLIECLWDTFGGSINDHGFKELEDHIGAIYGDSITLERQKLILERLKDKGFCSSNIVLGVGSYTYQMVTRDTHGMAIKATWVQIDGKGVEIFKDPKTDDGTKKSAKGLLQVTGAKDGKYLELLDQVSPKQSRTGMLDLVFRDGKLLKETTLAEIRTRVANNCYV